MKPIFTLFVLLWVTTTIATAQNERVVVDTITLTGHKRTRPRTILRELDFGQGDTIAFEAVQTRLERNRLLLLSTGLFSQVNFNIKDWQDDRIAIEIAVKEAWYFYPFLNIELADRNFNVWWVEQNRALNRLNFVLQASYRNLTGRRDLLKSYLQLGYETKFQVNYELPFFDRRQRFGLRYDLFYAQAKEYGFVTTDNVLRFSSFSEQTVIQRFRTSAQLKYQPKVYNRHLFEIFYHQNQIADSVLTVNPDYFLDNRTRQRYFAFNYQFIADQRDFRPYPMDGYFFRASVLKEGFGIFNEVNSLYVSLDYATYHQFRPKWSVELLTQGRYALLRSKQPYFNSRALGYSQTYMRGYEYYVMDGLDFALAQLSLRYEVLNKVFNFKAMPKSFQTFPFRIYAKVYHDEGYVHNPSYGYLNNDLTNTWLWSTGVGFDIVFYNDFTMQWEYTWNKLLENDLYLHFKIPF